MRHHARQPAPITAEQLRLAFRQISRPGWPRTLEAALGHPAYRVCLHGIARNLGRAGLDTARQRPIEPELPLFDNTP